MERERQNRIKYIELMNQKKRQTREDLPSRMMRRTVWDVSRALRKKGLRAWSDGRTMVYKPVAMF